MTARTPSAAAALPTARRSARLLTVATAAILAGGIALASPAAAVDDPTKPDALVTHGPSCRPGGVVVEVTGGTVDHAVTFATTRSPGGEDAAEVPAGATVVLRTGDVAWGETIDGRLEYVALDGSGATFVDELDGYTFTRPAEEDCAAIAGPAAAATVPEIAPEPDGGTPPPGDAAADGAAAGTAGTGHPPDGVPPDAVPADVRPDGTRPGGTDAPPGAATPFSGGKAEIPGTTDGVELIEAAAAPAGVTAASSPAPLVAAAVALGAAVIGLAGVAGRTRRVRNSPTGSA